jgi:hypothetical protein
VIAAINAGIVASYIEGNLPLIIDINTLPADLFDRYNGNIRIAQNDPDVCKDLTQGGGALSIQEVQDHPLISDIKTRLYNGPGYEDGCKGLQGKLGNFENMENENIRTDTTVTLSQINTLEPPNIYEGSEHQIPNQLEIAFYDTWASLNRMHPDMRDSQSVCNFWDPASRNKINLSQNTYGVGLPTYPSINQRLEVADNVWHYFINPGIFTGLKGWIVNINGIATSILIFKLSIDGHTRTYGTYIVSTNDYIYKSIPSGCFQTFITNGIIGPGEILYDASPFCGGNADKGEFFSNNRKIDLHNKFQATGFILVKELLGDLFFPVLLRRYQYNNTPVTVNNNAVVVTLDKMLNVLGTTEFDPSDALIVKL